VVSRTYAVRVAGSVTEMVVRPSYMSREWLAISPYSEVGWREKVKWGGRVRWRVMVFEYGEWETEQSAVIVAGY
jgi:hypothetical protein